MLFSDYCLFVAVIAAFQLQNGVPMPPRPPSTPRTPEPTTASRNASEEIVNEVLQIHLFGGDIVLTPEQQSTLEATSNQNDPFAPQNAVVRNDQFLWTDGIVYYVLDSSLEREAAAAITNAMNEYSTRTCIQFRERQNEDDFVRFFSGNGCFSYIGRVTGQQDISIGRGCEYPGIVMHEIFHALGRWHEQSRPDRDQFVTIKEENIQSGVESNFEKVSSSFATLQGVPYDYRSLMHYSAHAFTRNGRPTIEPKDPGVSLDALGQRTGFSTNDLEHVNALYCDESGSASWGSWGAWSSCSRTCNGGARTRMRTCVGGFTCSGSNIDSEKCNTDSCPVVATWGSWSSWSGCSERCGGGRRSRSRRCENGNTCVGRMTEFEDCNTDSCPEASSWSSWGSWSDCSQTCQGGTRFRRRRCQNGNLCEGSGVEVEYCNSNTPCIEGPAPTSEWSEWSECTAVCGGGTRFRTRECTGGGSNCGTDEQEDCNTQDCEPEPELRGLRHDGCYYVPAYSSVLFFLEGTTTDLSDNPLLREEPIRKCGTAAQELGFDAFAVSVGYCISGSNDVSDFQTYTSSQCENGEGGYYAGWFLMDVYEITNSQRFSDSVVQIINPEPPSQRVVIVTPTSALKYIPSSSPSATISTAVIITPTPTMHMGGGVPHPHSVVPLHILVLIAVGLIMYIV